MKVAYILFGIILAGSSPCLSTGAKASSLIGNSITAEIDFPSLGTPAGASDVFTPDPFTVGTGIEAVYSLSGTQIYNVDFSAQALTLTFLVNVSYSTYSFLGPVFTRSGSPFDSIATVSGIAAASVSEPSGELAINMSGVDFSNGDQIVVTFANSATPLPAALPLFASGLGGLGLLSWRRKRKAQAAA